MLLSAMVSKPDWLLTRKTKHFTNVVAQHTALRIINAGGVLPGPLSMIGRATLANSVVWNARGCSRFRITRTHSVARIDVQSS